MPSPLDDVRARLAEVADPLALLEAMFAGASVGLQIYRPDGRCVLVNPRFVELFGAVPPPDYNIFDDTILVERGVADLVRRGFAGETIQIPPIWYDARELSNVAVTIGRRIAVGAELMPLRNAAGVVEYALFVFHDVTVEHTALAEAAFLAEAGKVLASSLDYEATLEQIASLATSRFADFCLIDLIDDTGAFRRVAAVHKDPAGQATLDELRERFPPVPGSPQPAARVVAARQPELLVEVDTHVVASHTMSREHHDLMLRLGIRSHLAVPLMIGDRTLGAISFGYVGVRRYGPRDVDLAEALASRAALAIENARLYDEAQTASRSKDEFLAMLGHELRNPLAPILTALQLIEMREGPSRERSMIERQARHLTQLVDDLLDVSRITRGRIELHREPLSIHAAVQRALERARPLIDQRRHALIVDVPDDGTVVLADPMRLEQIIVNLLTNAARYTEPGGKVTVRAERRGDDIVLTITDTGLGISPALLPRIFDLFVQGARSAARSEGGLGLGLTIVKTLVVAHGGTVTARSDGPGKGTELTVVLPAAEGPDRSAAPAAPAVVPATAARRILVVDDNTDAAEVLAEVVTMFGYTTEVTDDPHRAIAMATEHPPDLAILDIGLPEMDGYELATRLRAIPSLAKIKLVAVTGYGQATDRDRALAAGFDHHLVKPVGIDVLSAVLAALMAEPVR